MSCRIVLEMFKHLLILSMIGCLTARSANTFPKPAYCNLPADIRANKTIEKVPTTDSLFNKVEKLVQVQTLFRHGARLYASSTQQVDCFGEYKVPWNCSIQTTSAGSDKKGQNFPPRLLRLQYSTPGVLKGNCMFGQLLKLGEEQHRANGENFLRAYIGSSKFNLLDTANSSILIDRQQSYLYSTRMERTLMSLQAFLSGVFPPVSDIVPVHSHDPDHDILRQTYTCPRIDAIWKLFAATKGKKLSAWENYTSWRAKWKKEVGQTIPAQDLGGYKLDCMECPICANMPLPPTLKVDTFTILSELESQFNRERYRFKNLSEEYTAPFLDMVHEKIKSVVQTGKMKLVFWSAHDTTVLALLESLKMWNGVWPHYAMVVTLEIYKMSGHTFSYGFRFTSSGKFLRFPSCGTNSQICDLAILEEVLTRKGMKLADWSKRCQNTSEFDLVTKSTGESVTEKCSGLNTQMVALISVASVAVLLLGCLFGAFLHYRCSTVSAQEALQSKAFIELRDS